MKEFPLFQRFQVGASLLPPIALAWLASRAGWLPARPVWFLAAMPIALAAGMAFPRPFAGWHRVMERGQAWMGHGLLSLLLGLTFVVVLVPIGLLLRCLGRSFLAPPSGPSYWTRCRPPGSLRDPF